MDGWRALLVTTYNMVIGSPPGRLRCACFGGVLVRRGASGGRSGGGGGGGGGASVIVRAYHMFAEAKTTCVKFNRRLSSLTLDYGWVGRVGKF